MYLLTDKQRQCLCQLKGLNSFHNKYSIPIFDQNQQKIGLLKPLTVETASNSTIISLLTKWRAANMDSFLTRFQANDARTKKWVTEQVLEVENKIFFLIYDIENRLIGHAGVRSITEVNAELDNIMRGEKSVVSKLVFYSLVGLMNWIYQELSVQRIYLNVISSNERAQTLYRALGFEQTNQFHLKKEKELDETRFFVIDSDKSVDCNLTLIRMDINKSVFYQKHFSKH